MRFSILLLCTLILVSTTLFGEDNKSMSDTPIKIKLSTGIGDVVIQLDADKAPETSKNFVAYTKDGFYDGTVFHRVIPGFMAQGGGFSTDFTQKTTKDPIKNEADNGLKNTLGTVAMARTNDPHSATSQFFINLKDNSFLDYKSSTPQGWGYTVFGKVIEGMDVVEKMATIPTGSKNGHQDVPQTDIVIESAQLISGD